MEEVQAGVTPSKAGKGYTREPPPRPLLDIRFDPYHNIREDQKKRVLGGQVSLWAEQVRPLPIVR
jgi:hypothetical protein